ncbi:DUF881 domain-containing protein [Candidatus Peregrinibacteria bacterium]|nr:DUF881 domain-containing protein [Candidatus Peregrinibacteria bacterium]
MNKIFRYIFLFTGLFVGLLFTWQFLSNASVVSDFPADEMEARDELFKDFLDEQSYLQSRIVFLREEIEDFQSEVELQSEVSNVEVLEDLKRDVGLSEVQGEGIEILLDDSPFALRSGSEVSDVELVQAADIRDIVNILYAANAEAISVNNQRIIATSPISSVGTTLLINNSYVAPPFTIKAIGDTEIMLERLLNENFLTSLFDRIRKYKVFFEVSVKNWLTIPIYNGDLKTSYLNLIDGYDK